MTLAWLDWLIVAGFLLGSLAIGLAYARRASSGIGEFFLSGRDLPWWLVGTSMVATTFAADTPLAVTGFIARDGIAGNWVWWSFATGGMLTVFLFARLWRRAGIMTDVELAELRYGGRPAAFLRGFRAVYLGLPVNLLIIGWVNVAMATVLETMMGWDRLTAVLVCLSIAGLYSTLSGLWGVVVTDFLQFGLAMIGCIVLALFALDQPEVGGLAGLRSRLPAQTLDFLPHVGGADAASLSIATFLAFIGVQWWATWYPGSEPGGGGYIAQRMMSAKSERHAVLATLWFTVAHYCVRPWPWIIIALCSLVLYPDLPDASREAGFVMVMRDVLPAGLRGLLLAAFIAAYMSTISTQLNWGSSYLVSDVYRRFVVRDASDAHYVRVSRAVTLLLMLLGGATTFLLRSVGDTWTLIFELGAGTGGVMILRWYWWRINAWSEIAALVAAAIGFVTIKTATDMVFPWTLFALTGWTTSAWLLVTLLTRPESDQRLAHFYRTARPSGPGWRRIARGLDIAAPPPLAPLLLSWLLGCAFVYSTLFAVGSALLSSSATAALPYLAIATVSLLLLIAQLRKRASAP